MKIILVSGARPNFMKIAPLIREFKRRQKTLAKLGVDYLFLHTGQHYDFDMMEVFFRDLGLPKPDINLGARSGSHAEQTAKIMVLFERVCLRIKPDLIMVVGDVNSTVACTLVAAKLGILTAHVEAGLRSYDRSMPEEINRILTDSIADILFTTCLDANNNLEREGIQKNRINFVGNLMIDNMSYCRKEALNMRAYEKYGLKKSNYALLTLHRPSNVDNKETFLSIISAILEISKTIPIVFPIHPRTKQIIKIENLYSEFKKNKNIIIVAPLGYYECLSLMMGAKLVMTDSGGIQEETTALRIPCLALRDNTERPITITQGTNKLVGNDKNRIIDEVERILRNHSAKSKKLPKYWDGQAAKRILDILLSRLIDHKRSSCKNMRK